MAVLPRPPRLGFSGSDRPPRMLRPAHDAPILDEAVRQRNSGQFHLFPLLPPELRLKIWNMNLPSGRVVPLRCGTASPSLHEKQRPSRGDASTGFTSSAPIPVNLHVCAESRAEAFKSYRRAFGFARRAGKVMFNPIDDILLFGSHEGYMAADSQFHTCMTMCEQAELACVRRVAISDSLFLGEDAYSSLTASSLSVEVVRQLAARMPLLEQIIFVPREEQTDDMASVRERMAHQIQMAVACVCQQVPHWRPPPWDIVCMSALTKAGG
ncbi:hypothetical protein XA68_14033 [Ophiocordyceps unilateralis]|uniref:2EXR domain-containing protein n=1 Tax=Ophiocordyceps unilateralis TaxID=268505 RepID=A0A2A9PBB8_OPHUN|nr:hypothetical protein XA68_14033 [Ophiocordyceps unilateralis]